MHYLNLNRTYATSNLTPTKFPFAVRNFSKDSFTCIFWQFSESFLNSSSGEYVWRVVSAIYCLGRTFVAEHLRCNKYTKHGFTTLWENVMRNVVRISFGVGTITIGQGEKIIFYFKESSVFYWKSTSKVPAKYWKVFGRCPCYLYLLQPWLSIKTTAFLFMSILKVSLWSSITSSTRSCFKACGNYSFLIFS